MKNNYEIKTVPNQRIVEISKEKCNKAELYAAINIDAMTKAALDLDAGAFKLWIYFAKNQDGFTFALSKRDAEVNFGIKKKAYYNAMNQLIEKGYLKQVNGNSYTFYEVPQMETPVETVKEEATEEATKETVKENGYRCPLDEIIAEQKRIKKEKEDKERARSETIQPKPREVIDEFGLDESYFEDDDYLCQDLPF